MSADQVLLVVFALSVVFSGLFVLARLGWCAYMAVGARQYRIAALAGIGIGCLVALFLAGLFMWFILAVSHMQKDVNDTYAVMACTGIPFFLASFGLWRLAARFQRAVAQQSVRGDPPASRVGPST